MGGKYCVLNFKAYANATGDKAVKLAKAVNSAASETNASFVICPQAVDLRAVVAVSKVPVFSQHVDADLQGAFTGSITPEAVKDTGATGSLVNHSEHKLNIEKVKETILRCESAGIFSLVCVATMVDARKVAGFKPDFIAIEPPELIGKGIAVSTANPAIIAGTVNEVKSIADIPVLCGAGISTPSDVKKAIELGADGVLLASAFVNSPDPVAFAKEIAAAF